MSMFNNLINDRMEFWAIDAKYLERKEFYYKMCGELEGMREAIIWITNCSHSEKKEALHQLATFREMLDTWYFRI